MLNPVGLEACIVTRVMGMLVDVGMMDIDAIIDQLTLASSGIILMLFRWAGCRKQRGCFRDTKGQQRAAQLLHTIVRTRLVRSFDVILSLTSDYMRVLPRPELECKQVTVHVGDNRQSDMSSWMAWYNDIAKYGDAIACVVLWGWWQLLKGVVDTDGMADFVDIFLRPGLANQQLYAGIAVLLASIVAQRLAMAFFQSMAIQVCAVAIRYKSLDNGDE